MYIDTCKKVPRYQSLSHDLKSKHHYMVHYAHILSLVGPLRNFWYMCFEAKHDEGKTIAALTDSRINICQSIALTQQLRPAYRLSSSSLFENNLEKGSRDTSGDYYAFNKSHTTCKWVKLNGYLYKAAKLFCA